MRHRKRVVPLIEDAVCARMRYEFARELGADAARWRQLEIAALPKRVWRGRLLHGILCRADFGSGPHLMYLPESVLWSLLSLDRYRCAYHHGGFFLVEPPSSSLMAPGSTSSTSSAGAGR